MSYQSAFDPITYLIYMSICQDTFPEPIKIAIVIHI